jgi:uncharacterized protein (TIGR03437 family)
MMKLAQIGAFLCVATAWPLVGQVSTPTFDTSGNGMLNGTYYFRHVIYAIDTSADSSGVYGDVSEAVAVYGTITFNGNGTYTIPSGTASDSTAPGQTIPLSCYIAGTSCTSGSAVNGTYSMSANGYGFIVDPITGDNVYGLLSSNNVFAGSSTETTIAYNDLFIAALIPSPAPGNSFFNGSYSVAGMFPSPVSALYSADAFFQVTANGAGSLGPLNVAGYYTNGGASTISQSISGASYFFSNGAAVITFPSTSNADFFPGGSANPEWVYFSADGNFFFGGSPTSGYDMIVGVKNSGTQNFAQPSAGSLYYNAGLYQDASQLSSQSLVDFDGYYGSFNTTSAGNIYAHQRLDSLFYGVYNNTYADSFTPPVSATYTDTAAYEQYAVGGGGAIRIGSSIWPYIGIDIGIQQPPPPATPPNGLAVFLYPQGVVNAASFSPFTAGVTVGEFVSLFGSNLAQSAVTAPGIPLPKTLGGVQVLVNGVAAPIHDVSPGQVNIVTPFDYPFAYAPFQVINNAGSSNTVTEPVYTSAPGVFTSGDSGIGDGAIQHADGSYVTESSPAQPGETVQAYASGLGAVYPAGTDGAAGPPLPNTDNVYPEQITVYVGGTQATVTSASLAPGLVGLYQVTFTVPFNAVAGDNDLDISPVLANGTTDSYNSQALIPVAASTASARQPAARARGRVRAASAKPRSKPCFFFRAKPGCKAS